MDNTHTVISRKRIFFVAIIVIVLAMMTQVAYASPIDDKRKKAAEIAAKIEINGDKISALSESYNYTTLQLSNLRSSVTDAQAQLASAEATNKEVSLRVQKRAVSMYSQASSEQVVTPGIDTQRRDQYANIASGNDSTTLQQLQLTQETVSERKAQLEGELSSIEKQEQALAEQKKELEAANAEQVKLLNQTKGELANLIAQQQQQQARERARAAAAAAASKRSAKPSSGNQSLPMNLPAPSHKAAAAIEFARQQLGKPYRYGATGPNSYDCSGLTMQAYSAAGISLPHYSGAQYAMFPKVPESMLQPGDLVFRGPGGSQHVGIYIGNGLMIHAPSTGDVVKISPIRNTIGGARPS